MPELDGGARRSSVRMKWIRCGKATCVRCPHGPYVYRVWREGKRVRSEYLGRAVAFREERSRVERDSPPAEHPHVVGAVVRFLAGGTPYWITVTGHRSEVHDDRPPLRVTATGWGRFGQRSALYAYVMLETLTGQPVWHPYDSTMTGPDPQRRLDRRFPVPLIEPAL